MFTGRLTSETGGNSEGNDTADEDWVCVMDVDDPSGLPAIAEGYLAFWFWN